MFAGFLVVSVFIFELLKCSGGTIQPTPKGMSTEDVKAIIDSNFASIRDSFIVVNSTMDAGIVSAILSKATVEQKEMLERLTKLQKEMAANGLKMTQFVEMNSSTSRNWETALVKLDSLQKVVLGLPKNAVGFGAYEDEWMNAVIWSDSSNTIHPSVTMRNVFDLVQYQTPDGKYWAKVENLNPYTSNEPGNNVFNLEIQSPLPEAGGRKWKIGFFANTGAVLDVGKVSPSIGGGVLIMRQ